MRGILIDSENNVVETLGRRRDGLERKKWGVSITTVLGKGCVGDMCLESHSLRLRTLGFDIVGKSPFYLFYR